MSAQATAAPVDQAAQKEVSDLAQIACDARINYDAAQENSRAAAVNAADARDVLDNALSHLFAQMTACGMTPDVFTMGGFVFSADSDGQTFAMSRVAPALDVVLAGASAPASKVSAP